MDLGSETAGHSKAPAPLGLIPLASHHLPYPPIRLICSLPWREWTLGLRRTQWVMAWARARCRSVGEGMQRRRSRTWTSRPSKRHAWARCSAGLWQTEANPHPSPLPVYREREDGRRGANGRPKREFDSVGIAGRRGEAGRLATPCRHCVSWPVAYNAGAIGGPMGEMRLACRSTFNACLGRPLAGSFRCDRPGTRR